jgi:uncharacterized phage protein (predicted DNA packaging)
MITDGLWIYKGVLEDIKEHLIIDVDYTVDDSYLKSLLTVSLMAIANHLNYQNDDIWKDWDEIPPPILHAIRMMVGHLYNNRESVSETKMYEVPMAISYLLGPYIKY